MEKDKITVKCRNCGRPVVLELKKVKCKKCLDKEAKQILRARLGGGKKNIDPKMLKKALGLE